MGQRDACRRALREALQRRDRLVQIEVGRWRRRTQDADIGKAHADRVAREEQAAVGVVQREVVLRVAGRVHGGQGPSRRHRDLLAVLEDVHARRGCGVEAPVQGVEEVAVDHRRALDEPLRVDEVPGALLVDVHRGVREGVGHVADAAGVVEVDVGDGDAGEVVAADAELVERGEQRGHRGLAAGLDQDRARCR